MATAPVGMSGEKSKVPGPAVAQSPKTPDFGATETKAPEAPVKAKVERVVESVKMSDGRVVDFVGKKRLDKETIIEGDAVKVRLDFRNGTTRTFVCPQGLVLRAAGHGLEQKLGDETAGEDKLDDMILAVDELMARLAKGEWTTVRAAGDSFSGASIVIRALVEVTKKPVETIKAFLQGKLDAAKAKGETLSRKALYDSFRNPATEVGKKIRELEDADRAKSGGFDAAGALSELQGM